MIEVPLKGAMEFFYEGSLPGSVRNMGGVWILGSLVF